MVRKECAPNEGLHQDISEVGGSDSSEHAPGSLAGGSQGQLTTISLRGGAGGEAGGQSTVESAGPSGTSSPNTHGEHRPDDDPELDPAHVCKEWPCPQCHKPRDADDEMTANAGQYSTEAATSTQSFFHPHEPLQLEQSEDADDDLLEDIAAPSAVQGTQNHKGHCS